jgi:hypothetical protein
MLPKTISLVSTVLLLMSLGFFVLGSAPLLILKHDAPMDSRFIRQVFNHCYRLVAFVATAASIGFGLGGQTLPAAGLACVAILALASRHWLLTRMDRLRQTMHDGDRAAIRRFRELHVTGILLNLTQLVVLGWGLTSVL